MKIGIDARFLRSEGVGRYIEELVQHLPKVDPGNRYHMYCTAEAEKRRLMSEAPNLKASILPAMPFSPWEQPLLTLRLRKDRLALFHATNCWTAPLFSPCPVVVTVHDVFHRRLPEAVSFKARVYGHLFFPLALARAERIIAVSRFTAEELLRYYPKTAGRITVIYHGMNPVFTPLRDSEHLRTFREKYEIPPRYFLYVGSPRRYKNLTGLLEAFSLLPRHLQSTLAMVIRASGPQLPDLVRRARAFGLQEKVRFIEWLPSEDLVPLYSGALAFVTVSLYESFCYPVVEAMACGTPVIAPNHLALPEITQGAALLVDPHDLQAIKEAMERVATDDSLRGDLVEKGLQRAKDFPWRGASEEVVRVYHEVLSR